MLSAAAFVAVMVAAVASGCHANDPLSAHARPDVKPGTRLSVFNRIQSALLVRLTLPGHFFFQRKQLGW